MAGIYTYNPKQVVVSFDNHALTGPAEDNFIVIDPHTDGTQVKVGCYGDLNRAISVDEAATIKVSLLQNSPTNQWLRDRYKQDQIDGTGYFPIMIRDLMGNEKFSSPYAFVTKPASWGRGKDTTDREWEIVAADAKYEDD